MSVTPPRNRPSTHELGAQRLGPYVLVQDVAASELNTIHLARPYDDGHDGENQAQKVVVKRLRREFSRDLERRQALEREASLLGQLRSPYIVRSVVSHDLPEACVVMEHLQGVSLAALLAQADPSDIETTRMVVPLIVDALWGLDDLHRPQPANGGTFLVHQAPCARHVMVSFNGRARIIDLTLAMGPELARSSICDQRLRPEEMAPEQALAPSNVDPRCDVFIAGLMLWEALTGKRLFEAPSAEAALEKMLRSAIVSPSEALAPSRRSLDRVCMRALMRSRAQRYSCASEMAGELTEQASKVGLFADRAELAEWMGRVLSHTPRSAARNSKLNSTMQGLGGLDGPYELGLRRRSGRESEARSPIVARLGPSEALSMPPPTSDAPLVIAAPSSSALALTPNASSTARRRRSRSRVARTRLNIALATVAALSVAGALTLSWREPAVQALASQLDIFDSVRGQPASTAAVATPTSEQPTNVESAPGLRSDLTPLPSAPSSTSSAAPPAPHGASEADAAPAAAVEASAPQRVTPALAARPTAAADTRKRSSNEASRHGRKPAPRSPAARTQTPSSGWTPGARFGTSPVPPSAPPASMPPPIGAPTGVPAAPADVPLNPY